MYLGEVINDLRPAPTSGSLLVVALSVVGRELGFLSKKLTVGRGVEAFSGLFCLRRDSDTAPCIAATIEFLFKELSVRGCVEGRVGRCDEDCIGGCN